MCISRCQKTQRPAELQGSANPATSVLALDPKPWTLKKHIGWKPEYTMAVNVMVVIVCTSHILHFPTGTRTKITSIHLLRLAEVRL